MISDDGLKVSGFGSGPFSIAAYQAARLIQLAYHIMTLFALPSLVSSCIVTGKTLAVAPTKANIEKYVNIVVDANNDHTLYQAYATASRYPASLTKMMTLHYFSRRCSRVSLPRSPIFMSRIMLWHNCHRKLVF